MCIELAFTSICSKETLIRPSGTFSHPAPLALRSTGEGDDF
jgi:hypothetical protein